MRFPAKKAQQNATSRETAGGVGKYLEIFAEETRLIGLETKGYLWGEVFLRSPFVFFHHSWKFLFHPASNPYLLRCLETWQEEPRSECSLRKFSLWNLGVVAGFTWVFFWILFFFWFFSSIRVAVYLHSSRSHLSLHHLESRLFLDWNHALEDYLLRHFWCRLRLSSAAPYQQYHFSSISNCCCSAVGVAVTFNSSSSSFSIFSPFFLPCRSSAPHDFVGEHRYDFIKPIKYTRVIFSIA